jgi:2-polyprenyl-6-methoxyphenol hydroxylase-like FAD-dependent oxidoreductase
MKIAIIGGGIGSMTLALALHAAGFNDVDIHESASAIPSHHLFRRRG